MIDHAEHFRGQARECRRLSGRANRRDDVRVLTEMADELAGLVSEFNAFVNLIPFNPIPGTEWRPSKRQRLNYFVERLESRGISAFVRESRGSDIAAACGQLRAEVTQGRTPVQMGSI